MIHLTRTPLQRCTYRSRQGPPPAVAVGGRSRHERYRTSLALVHCPAKAADSPGPKVPRRRSTCEVCWMLLAMGSRQGSWSAASTRGSGRGQERVLTIVEPMPRPHQVPCLERPGCFEVASARSERPLAESAPTGVPDGVPPSDSKTSRVRSRARTACGLRRQLVTVLSRWRPQEKRFDTPEHVFVFSVSGA